MPSTLKKRIQSISESGTYSALICLLALISVVLAFMDFSGTLSPVLVQTDLLIYLFFVFDYSLRFAAADEKMNFFRSNLFDLAAILPFSSALRVFRTFKAVKIFRLAKVFRIGSVSGRLLQKSKQFLNTNGFKYVLLLSLTSIVLAYLAMTILEKMDFPDALWWSFVTATTVGYGDLSPATGASRIVASLLMLVGIGLIGSLTSSITSYFMTRPAADSCSSDKVMMVLRLYDELNDEERKQFKERI